MQQVQRAATRGNELPALEESTLTALTVAEEISAVSSFVWRSSEVDRPYSAVAEPTASVTKAANASGCRRITTSHTREQGVTFIQ
jgi:hypothetical protein